MGLPESLGEVAHFLEPAGGGDGGNGLLGVYEQFGGFLRMVITSLRKAIAAPDIETMRALLQELLNDLQNTLED